MNGVPAWLLVVLGVIVVLVGINLLMPHTASNTAPRASTPEILQVEFPKEITADGNSVTGQVRFRDLDGDIVRAEFDVVEATVFTPFAYDPEVQGVQEGTFEFSVYTVISQEIVLRVTLIDAQGQRSRPVEFRFIAQEPEM